MRTKKRVAKIVVAAIAVATLGSVAPANAGCAYVTLYVKRDGVPTYVANDQCVNTPWVTDQSGVDQEVGTTSPSVAVGVGFTPATPP